MAYRCLEYSYEIALNASFKDITMPVKLDSSRALYESADEASVENDVNVADFVGDLVSCRCAARVVLKKAFEDSSRRL